MKSPARKASIVSARSRQMSLIKSGGNKSTELALIRHFKANHVTGWRRNYPLFGKPDFVFPATRVAIFVDGCFWHGHPTLCRMPASNRKYWIKKIRGNVRRDLFVRRKLIQVGWKVVRIWESDLNSTRARLVIRKIKKANQSNVFWNEMPK